MTSAGELRRKISARALEVDANAILGSVCDSTYLFMFILSRTSDGFSVSSHAHVKSRQRLRSLTFVHACRLTKKYNWLVRSIMEVSPLFFCSYKQSFDIEGESGVVVRGIGTCVGLVPKPPNLHGSIPVCFPATVEGLRPVSTQADGYVHVCEVWVLCLLRKKVDSGFVLCTLTLPIFLTV